MDHLNSQKRGKLIGLARLTQITESTSFSMSRARNMSSFLKQCTIWIPKSGENWSYQHEQSSKHIQFPQMMDHLNSQKRRKLIGLARLTQSTASTSFSMSRARNMSSFLKWWTTWIPKSGETWAIQHEKRAKPIPCSQMMDHLNSQKQRTFSINIARNIL